MMKVSKLLLIGLLSSVVGDLKADSEYDYRLSAHLAPIEQTVTLGFESKVLKTINKGFSFGMYGEDWALSSSVNFSGDEQTWENDSFIDTAEFDQLGYDLNYSYYLDNWSFNASIGHNELEYLVTQYLPNPNFPVTTLINNVSANLNSTDKYYQLSVGYWLTLPSLSDNLAASFDLAATYVDTSGELFNQVTFVPLDENLEEFNEQRDIFTIGLEEQHWVTSFTASIDYAATLFKREFYWSLWSSYEYSADTEAKLSFRRKHPRAPHLPAPFPLDDENQPIAASESWTYGIDTNMKLTENTSLWLYIYDSDYFDTQYQLSVDYRF